VNLNRHTVTYGTRTNPVPAYGILGAACWDRDFGVGNPCGGSSNNLTVYGGTITQNVEAAPFSHGIRLGQGPRIGPTVHDVTFNISAKSSIPIYTTYAGTGASIYGNIIHNDVTLIDNRHQLHGQSIKLADTSHIHGPAAIFGNHITGGAQGGIFSAVPATMIHDNVISQKGTYTNDFGIYAWSDAGEVYNNVVIPTLGRGILIASSTGERVHDNKVIVIEQKDNEEYGGCQSGGTFGIQFDDNPKSGVAFHNNVTAKADQCGAQALRVTESLEGSENLSHDNQYVAERVGNSEAFASGFGSGGATGFTSEHDFFSGDTSVARFDWDGAANLTFRGCTFAKGANPASDFVTFSFRNGGTVPVKNIHFIDSIFLNGAAKDDTDMKPILSVADWPGPAEYFIDWTVKLSVQDQGREPVVGASIEIKNALNHPVFEGLTDKNGTISTTLAELKIYNNATQVKKEFYTPYSLNVHKDGCQPNSQTVTQVVRQIITINCSSHQ
jgi:hypothetical protein